MAKVKFSALISEMRNKLNGSVFARNRGGNYLRTKVTPINPKSLAQVLVRARLAGFAQAWRSLSEAQRGAWNAAVSQWTTTDVFGDVQTPTGNTLFSRLNLNIVNAGGSAIQSPPSPQGAEALTNLTLAADSAGPGVFEVGYAPTDVPTGHALVIEATPSLSPGLYNVNNRFRQIAVLDAGTSSEEDIIAQYQAKFGSLIQGQKVHVRAKLVRLATGEVSQSLTATSIVA